MAIESYPTRRTRSSVTAGSGRLDRRRLVQGAAATPFAFGAIAAPFAGRQGRAQDVTEVSFWTHTHPPMVELNEELIAAFVEQNPDIDVAYEIVPNMNFAERLLTSVSTGTGPDVINMDDNQMRSIYIPNGLVGPVDPAALGFGSMDELQAAYIPGAFQGAEVDGEIYGLPSEFNVTAFIINTAAFEEAGLDPDSPPTTWEEVGTMGEALVQRDGDTVTRRGFDFLYLHAGWYHNQFGTLLLQTGGRLVAEDGTTAAVNEPAAVEALQIWYDMVYTYGVADPNIASREATVPYQDFIDGNVAMSLMNPWGLGLITAESPVFDNYRVVPLPQVDPASPVNPLYAYYWSVVEQSEVKEDAFKLISFLASDPGAWLADVEFIQPRAGWDELPEVETFPFYDVWAAELLNGQFQPVVPNSQEVDAIVMSAIENSILNAVPPQEALDQAAEQINQVLQAG
ncbi:MAG: ABC transporter substrate-binding protein [Chloroflexia bacterium]|nr:ABC transporter substrate-binding protein [Chloroflexia bacterium]